MTASIAAVSTKLLCIQYTACLLGHSQCPTILVLVEIYSVYIQQCSTGTLTGGAVADPADLRSKGTMMRITRAQ